MTERIIRTPAETEALCIGLPSAARMLREHAAECREKGEEPTAALRLLNSNEWRWLKASDVKA